MAEDLQKFSDDPTENYCMENEFLRMKIAAQFGGDFGTMSGGLPPDIENQFLKNVLNFENHAAAEPLAYKTVNEILGKPAFTPGKDLAPNDLGIALKKVHELYAVYNLQVNFISDYPDMVKYEFMTQELLDHESDTNFAMPGMTCNYIYEEFHPNHGYDLEEQAVGFISAWFQKDLAAIGNLLTKKIPLDQHTIIDKDEVLKKIIQLFDSFSSFQNCDYIIGQLSYDLDPDEDTGMAYAEGGIKYDGIMETGEAIHFEGPMKIYFAKEGYYWDVIFFHFPGFKWI